MWPHILWVIAGLDCHWALQPCDGLIRQPYWVLTEAVVLPVLGLALIGLFTCLRLLVRLLSALIRPTPTPEQKLVQALMAHSNKISERYLEDLLSERK